MGKKSRLKKERKQMEEKKEEKVGDQIVEGKPELMSREVEGFYLKKNVDALTKLGWDKNGLLEMIKKAENVSIPIDPNIVLSGVKNPLVTVYIGFSTRKLYDAMIRKKKVVKYCLIIEPNIAAFKHLISTEDISDLLLKDDVDFIVGMKGHEMLPYIFRSFTKPFAGSYMARSTIVESMQIILDPFQYNTEESRKYGEEIMGLVKESSNQLKLSMGCSDDQYRRFELMMANKKNMYNSWKIGGLYDKFKDIPVICLGGGPSLNDFIEEYKKNPNLKNAVIIAADAVLFKLLQAGIKPNIVTRCERKLTNIFKGVTKEQTKGIYYAAYPWTPPEYFDLFDDHFYLFRQNGVCFFTEVKHAYVDGGVSSGNACLELAINLGARDIILSGIDLCFIDGKTHVDGTQVEFNIEKSKDKHFQLECNDGQERKCIPVWERCRNEYMQSIDKWRGKGKEFRVWNTSTKGAVIPLTEVKTWDKIILPPDEVNVQQLIEKYREKVSQEEIDNFEKIIKDTLNSLKEYLNITNIAIGLGEDARRTCDREIQKLFNSVTASIKDPYDMIKAFRSRAANFEKLWANVSDSYDMNFKQKLYTDRAFRILIFDVLQLDLYHTENMINAMVNTTDFTDERHFGYYMLTKEFAIKVKYYLEMFIDLFSK